MKINGFWLGAGLIMLVDYIWFIFSVDYISYLSVEFDITFILLIVFFGLAFRDKQKSKKELAE